MKIIQLRLKFCLTKLWLYKLKLPLEPLMLGAHTLLVSFISCDKTKSLEFDQNVLPKSIDEVIDFRLTHEN